VWSPKEEPGLAELSDILARLSERDYILRLPDSTFPNDVEYVFRHRAERERIAALTSPSDARRWHRLLADWLDSQPETRSHEEYLELLADQREKAGASESAAGAYLEAAGQARAHASPKRELAYYEKALGLLEDGHSRRLTALLRASELLEQLDRVEAALDRYRQASALAFRLNRRRLWETAHLAMTRLREKLAAIEEAKQAEADAIMIAEAKRRAELADQAAAAAAAQAAAEAAAAAQAEAAAEAEAAARAATEAEAATAAQAAAEAAAAAEAEAAAEVAAASPEAPAPEAGAAEAPSPAAPAPVAEPTPPVEASPPLEALAAEPPPPEAATDEPPAVTTKSQPPGQDEGAEDQDGRPDDQDGDLEAALSAPAHVLADDDRWDIPPEGEASTEPGEPPEQSEASARQADEAPAERAASDEPTEPDANEDGPADDQPTMLSAADIAPPHEGPLPAVIVVPASAETSAETSTTPEPAKTTDETSEPQPIATGTETGT
jgi:hypothetical protein